MRKEEKEMKGKENHKIGSRVLAAVLSILMVLSLVPTSTWTVLAATPEYPETVTITVKDEAGQALSGAIVDYKINSVINGEEYQKNTVLTDDNGVAAVLVSGDYVENDLTICASILRGCSRSGLCFAFISTAPIAATIIRFTAFEITVAVATPMTPQ